MNYSEKMGVVWMRFSERIVIITGGAAGIGRGIAECFAYEGANVVILDINEEDGQETCEYLLAKGYKISFIRTDIRIEQHIVQAVSQVFAQFGRVDVLVNNAGVHFAKEITDITLDYWDTAVATNLRGHFLMTREVVPHMKLAGKGSIVNIASVHAWLTQPGCAVYAATKGGIVSMTRSMAIELAPFGIRVNAVLPGLTRNKGYGQYLEKQTDESKKSMVHTLQKIPLEKIAEPEHIGWSVAFLSDDRACHITGVSLPVDGGETIHL
jgi:NAD(P)-dependent dehydrogenase (short-subunit alcohol dehydrogenase family)